MTESGEAYESHNMCFGDVIDTNNETGPTQWQHNLCYYHFIGVLVCVDIMEDRVDRLLIRLYYMGWIKG